MQTIKNVRLETNNQNINIEIFFVKDMGLINDAKPKTVEYLIYYFQLHFPMRYLVIYQERH